ncbi:hypothetical protein WJX81_008429 [Elliptochloris bilobata]|uniref:ODAD1 central coiled coil region domain-containing protein n=1 Tax=Elliptochloris bilobata TaxID=381761 RepID=A0AAW1RW94_9CHLO
MDAQPFAETQQFFVKQRAAIDRLRADNVLLKEEVMLENRFSVAPTSAAAATAILGLQEQSEVYNQKIGAERARMLDLREKLAALRARVAEQRRAMGGVNAARDGDMQACKIHSHGREAHAAGAGRERAQAEAGGLKAAADREQANAEAEWRQLTQLLEHARQQREAARNREIEARDLQTLTVLSSEVGPRRRTASPASGGARTGAAAADRLRELGAAFDAVLAATGAADVDALAATIVAGEDTNFRLLGYVGAVNAEADALEAAAADLRGEVAAAGDAAAAADAARRAVTQELEGRLSATEASASGFEGRRDSAAACTSRLRDGLAMLWQRAGCDTPAVRALLGSGGPTDASLMQFLGVLEQRTHELLQAYVAKVVAEGPGQQKRARALLAPPSAPGSGEAGAAITVDPPTTVPPPAGAASAAAGSADGSDGSGAEDDDQPLDRQALYQRVQRSLARHSPAAATPLARPKHLRSGGQGRYRSVASGGLPTTGVGADEDLAVVLVDHGSKRVEANKMLEEFAELYRQTTQRQLVEIAHMELAQPSIADAVAKCAAAGAKKVVVAPYFLSRGRHITEDIPALVASAQAEHPSLQCVVADPIGIDPLMVQLIEKRVADTLPAAT